jgi:hypothetical protein
MTRSLRIISSPGIAGCRAAALEAFERDAARIMRRRGRCAERAIRPARGASSDAELPVEVRVLRFPGPAQDAPTHTGRKARTAPRAPMLPASTRSVGLHHHFISPLLTLAPISIPAAADAGTSRRREPPRPRITRCACRWTCLP